MLGYASDSVTLYVRFSIYGYAFSAIRNVRAHFVRKIATLKRSADGGAGNIAMKGCTEIPVVLIVKCASSFCNLLFDKFAVNSTYPV